MSAYQNKIKIKEKNIKNVHLNIFFLIAFCFALPYAVRRLQ